MKDKSCEAFAASVIDRSVREALEKVVPPRLHRELGSARYPLRSGFSEAGVSACGNHVVLAQQGLRG
jgi:hypothetical protein